MKIGIITMAL